MSGQLDSEFADRPGKKKAVTGVVELDAARPLPTRGNRKHWPLGQVLANYFYVGDKPFGVEPGPLPVKINGELLENLIEGEVIEFNFPADQEIYMALLRSIQENSDLERQIKEEKEKSGEESPALNKLIEEERASADKLASFLQGKMKEVHAIVDQSILEEDKREKEILAPGTPPKPPMNRLITKEEAAKKGIDAKEYDRRQEKLKKLGEVIQAIKTEGMSPKEEESGLWLIKQDYNDDAPIPSKYRLGTTTAVKSGKHSLDDYYHMKLAGAKLGEGQEGETKNAIVENLGNDVAGLMMQVQRQHLVVKDGAKAGDNLRFLTACQWETKLDIMTGCLAGSKGNNKYYVKVERHPEGHRDAGKPIEGRNLQILSKLPEDKELEENQYFLFKGPEPGAKWQLFRSELSSIRKKIQLREIPLNTSELLALQKKLGNSSVEEASKQQQQKDIHDALDQGLTALDKRINSLAEPEKQKARNKFGREFYQGPIPLRENGFYVPDDTLENLGQHAAIMFFIGDNDTLGSQGQNKGRVGNTFFGLDFGHAFRDKVNPLAKNLRTDLSFNGNKSFKNMGTFFHDTELSDRMKGMFFLYKAMGEDNRKAIFEKKDRAEISKAIKKYEEKDTEFKKKMDEIEDGGIPKVFKAYENKMDDLIKKELAKSHPNQKQIKAYQSYKKEIQKKQKTANESLQVMGKKMNGRMQLGPQEVDLLQNLERLCSKTTRVSKSGQCLLKHLQVVKPKKNRVEWSMTKGKNVMGEEVITLTAKVPPKKQAKLIKLLHDYKKKFNIEDMMIGTGANGEPSIKCKATQLEKLFELFKEDNIKQFKTKYYRKLDATPESVKSRLEENDNAAKTAQAATATKTLPPLPSTPRPKLPPRKLPSGPRPVLTSSSKKPPQPKGEQLQKTQANTEPSTTLSTSSAPKSQSPPPRRQSWLVQRIEQKAKGQNVAEKIRQFEGQNTEAKNLDANIPTRPRSGRI